MTLCAALVMISTLALGAPAVPSLEMPVPEPVVVVAEFPVQDLVTPDPKQILNELWDEMSIATYAITEND